MSKNANIINDTSYKAVVDAGKQLVVKRNDFIQEARFSLNGLTNRILDFMFSKVQPDDEPGKVYEYRYAELFAVMGYKTTSYTDARKIVQALNALSFWRDSDIEGGDDELITFFDSDTILSNAKYGTFKAAFSEKLYPYILDLQKQKKEKGLYYTSYALLNVIMMKRYYSQRLYALLKSYQYNNQKWVFEIGTGSIHDLHRRLAPVNRDTQDPKIPEGWKNWYIFNRDVLKPAEADINLYTDIKIKYIPSKYDLAGHRHRGYASVTFAMVSKTPDELEERDSYIDSRYRNLQKEEMFRQTTLEEFLSDQDEKFKREEKKKEEEKAMLVKERQKKSDTPLLTDNIGKYFTDSQIKSLYWFAIRNIPDGKIALEDNDKWATEYIGFYLEKIKATPDRTKTTVYERLLDMVTHDREKIAEEITEKNIRYKSSLENYLKDLSAIREHGKG